MAMFFEILGFVFCVGAVLLFGLAYREYREIRLGRQAADASLGAGLAVVFGVILGIMGLAIVLIARSA